MFRRLLLIVLCAAGGCQMPSAKPAGNPGG